MKAPGVCMFCDAVDCEKHYGGECYYCGFNPAEDKKRREDIRAGRPALSHQQEEVLERIASKIEHNSSC